MFLMMTEANGEKRKVSLVKDMKNFYLYEVYNNPFEVKVERYNS